MKKHYKEILIFALFLIAYIPSFMWMSNGWFSRDSYYSHGILIPFVTAFMIWQQRQELKKIKIKESPWGIWLIVIGIIIHLASMVVQVNFSSGFSMLLVLVGIILYLYGWECLKIISFPVAFLIFMVPLPSVAIVNLSFRLKLFAAQIATMILNGINIDAVQEGSLIRMRETFVVVEDVCSGLRSLISLTALGSIVAFWMWMKSELWKRIILFLSTIPIAIITNVCRVVFLAFVSEVWGSQYLEGAVHDISGLMVFALAFVLFIAFGKIIE